MDSTGGFHMKEKDGKLYQLEYYHPKYHPIQQTQSSTSYGEAIRHEQPFHCLFLCPIVRSGKEKPRKLSPIPLPLDSSPEYILSKQGVYDHHVLPLYWCNNKEFDVDGTCEICNAPKYGTYYYYFCVYHGKKYHKECVESPAKLKNPYHPEHSLQLSYTNYVIPHKRTCLGCGKTSSSLVYYCTICEFFMHPTCAMKPITFVIDQPKRHDHPLTLFPRQTSLTCNICGLLRKFYPTYVCLRCNFVAHRDCMYSPHIIKISRHHHRISYNAFRPSKELYCGVCRQSIDTDYGAYTCEKCSDYFVHSRCALGKDVWDGKELEGVIEMDDITQDASSFDMISEGVILHFLHDHHLRLEVSILYDENKLCQACVLPIYEGNFYSCMECEFILHETCVMAPRRIQHALHPHPLTLKNVSGYDSCSFRCNACDRSCSGFVYECHIGECTFDLDVRCASISEPFDYKAHEHPLFLALDPIKNPHVMFAKPNVTNN